MSLENVLAFNFLAALTADQRKKLDELGEGGVRAHLDKLFLNQGSTSTLPEGWTLSLESITVIVDYDDPRWDVPPSRDGVYGSVSEFINPSDFPKGERTGKWEITLRWLNAGHRVRTSLELARYAIMASGFTGANRAETETVITTYPRNWWVGFGVSRESYIKGFWNGKRSFCFNRSMDSLRSCDFLVVCEAKPI